MSFLPNRPFLNAMAWGRLLQSWPGAGATATLSPYGQQDCRGTMNSGLPRGSVLFTRIRAQFDKYIGYSAIAEHLQQVFWESRNPV